MKMYFSWPLRFGWVCTVAFLALQTAPAAQTESSGSGSFVGTDGTEPVSVIFKDVYAFRAEDSFDKTKVVTVVVLSDSPLDKQALTGALRKERDRRAITRFLDNMAYVRLAIDQDGKITSVYVFKAPSFNYNYSGGGKSDVKVNTANRVEGRFSTIDATNVRGDARKMDVSFATNLADIGLPVKN